jgi:uncharacterized protein YbaR (Trm112 family)
MAVLVEHDAGDRAVLSETLADVLVCPVDHADLRLVGTTLVCTRCERVYPIDDGIPNLLVEDG